MTHPEALLTPDEVKAFLSERGMVISVERIREQIVAGSLPGHKVGRFYVTPLPALRAWMECKPEPAPTPIGANVHSFIRTRAAS
ncbi:MAG: hypothetical protein IT337_12605 [Thermomicrobiales bacterium]|nr:hypothetical protein [Thermomicrobiales bacterium]